MKKPGARPGGGELTSWVATLMAWVTAKAGLHSQTELA